MQISRKIISFAATMALSWTLTQPMWAGSRRASQFGSSQHQMMPMPLLAPLFFEDAGISSTATIVNAAAAPTSADLILLDQQGLQITSETLRLPGHSQRAVRIGDLLRKAYSVATMGSVKIMPEAKAAQGMSVVAQLSIVDNRRAVPAYLEEEFLMPSMKSSNIFRAAASSVIGHPVLALTSTSMQPQAVTVNCIREHAESRTSAVQLAPGEMRLMRACAAGDERVPAFDMAVRQDVPEPGGAVGISVATNGMPGELGVYGFVLRGDRERPEYAALNFNDTGMLRSSNTVFTGVPVGKTDLLAGETFRPELAVANFGLQPATARVLYTTTDEGGTNGKTVAKVILPPSSSTTVELPRLTGDPGMRNSFVVESNVPPGSLAANLIAVGGTMFRIVQLIGKDENGMNGGSHPWALGRGTASTLLLFNPTSSEQEFDVRIAAHGMLWIHSYRLERLETKAVDIGALVANGEKDATTKTPSTYATQGEVNWSTESSGQGNGRLVVSQPERALARNFSCGTQIGPCGLVLSASSLDILDNSNGNMGPALEQLCVQPFPVGGCGGSYDYSKGTSATWSSSATSVATVNGSGTVTGKSGGTATIQAAYEAGSCFFSGSGPARVHVPFSVSPVATISQGQAYCADVPHNGYLRTVTNQVYDNFGEPYKVAGVSMTDTIQIGTPNQLNITTADITQPGAAVTNANGQFGPDNYSVCSAVCYGPGLTDATQEWYFNGILLPSASELQYTCSGITINGK